MIGDTAGGDRPAVAHMGRGRWVRWLLVVIALAGASFHSALFSAQAVNDAAPDWGPATDGLRMAITWVNPSATTVVDAEFRIAFQNTGSQDVLLNLGYTVEQTPRPLQLSAIRLTVRDSKGGKWSSRWNGQS